MSVSASFTALRQDLQRVSDALAETTLSASVLMRPEGSTTDYFSIHLPYFTTPVPDKSEATRALWPRPHTYTLPTERVGTDPRGGASHTTQATFHSSKPRGRADA